MPDQIDEAQRYADQHQADALAAHHRRVDEIRTTHGRRDCEECGEEIPARRRAAGGGPGMPAVCGVPT